MYFYFGKNDKKKIYVFLYFSKKMQKLTTQITSLIGYKQIIEI